ncbi:Transcription initiation factor IIB [Dictyocoela muelleri]|nr:Transcription initiation factor IIB [Dictyocoela muelleri]
MAFKVKPAKLKCNCENPHNIVEDHKNGYSVCKSCGTILQSKLIDEGMEWRSFGDNNTDPSRVGAPSNPLLESEQLDTVIGGKGGNAFMLNKIHLKSTMRGPERGLINGFNLITAFCDRSNFQKQIADRAKYIYKVVDDKKLLKGKNLEGSVGACIYIACRQLGCARTFKEISVLTNVPKKEIGRCYKLMHKHVDLLTCVETKDIVSRFCSDLSLNIKLQNLATEISTRAQQNGCVAGKSPDSVAAAVIYLVTNLYPELKDIQKNIPYVTNVTDVTIKNTYKDLLNVKDIIIPTDKYNFDLSKLPSS